MQAGSVPGFHPAKKKYPLTTSIGTLTVVVSLTWSRTKLAVNGLTAGYGRMHPDPARDLVRHGALSILATFYKATGLMSSGLAKNRIQFLYLHYLFEDEKNSFRKLLTRLSIDHSFISYSEAVDRILQGRIDRPYITISFDDGLKDSLAAAELMNEFGISACFFTCSSMVGETDSQRVREFCAQNLYMPPTEFLSWDDLGTLLKAGHEIGSHSMTHPNLAKLSGQELQAEIAGSFEVLTRELGQVKHFAWPYGHFSDFNASAAKVVFESGFKSCASAERGCHVVQANNGEASLCIRRDNTVAKWPIDHLLYLMARNSQLSSAGTNQWPQPRFESNALEN
jgi:peptidoglycan/xylan/chitin deacetylase (PgdA/CDA1 family)